MLPILTLFSVQVNLPAESGEMGVLANHVPSIEQLKPGLVEVIEEAGGSKQFFCTCTNLRGMIGRPFKPDLEEQVNNIWHC
jgi:hypothetical protein